MLCWAIGMGTSRASLFYFFFTVFINAPMDPAAKGYWIQDINPETSFEMGQYYIPATQGDVIQWFNRNAVGSPWDVQSIPYQISYQLAHREEVLTASLEEISQNTCVKFHPQTTEVDYLFFTDGSGCASYLGKIGGKQPVYLSERCLKGNIVHELMHALGFHHEHMRQDRDESINVLYENIIPEKVKNFDKIDGDVHGLPYDTGSIMHYGEKFFSLNGEPTVISKGGEPIGQRDRLSELDVKRVQLLYKCDMGIASQLGQSGTVEITTVVTSTGEQTNTPAPVSAQSTTAPVSAQSTTAPVSAQSTTAPVSAQSATAPVSAQSATAPVSAQSATAPVSAQSATAPVSAQSATAPVSAQSATAPVSAQSATAPVSATSRSAPVISQSTP